MPSGTASTAPGWRSTISTTTRAACRRRSCSWPMWRRRRRGSGSAPASSPCRSRSRCGSPRMPRCSTPCRAAGSSSASARAARRRPSRPSGRTAPRAAPIFGRHLGDAARGAGRPDPRATPTTASTRAGRASLDRIWQATFSVEGGRRAGRGGRRPPAVAHPAPAGRMRRARRSTRSRTRSSTPISRPAGRPRAAHRRLAQRLRGRPARRGAAPGRDRAAARRSRASKRPGFAPRGDSLADLIATYDVHVGTPDEVIASLRADTALARVTDLAFQVHSVDPPHAAILRSIELVAAEVAPALGWVAPAEPSRRHAAQLRHVDSTAGRLRMPHGHARHHRHLVGIAPGSPLDRIRAAPAAGARERAGELSRAVRSPPIPAACRCRALRRGGLRGRAASSGRASRLLRRRARGCTRAPAVRQRRGSEAVAAGRTARTLRRLPAGPAQRRRTRPASPIAVAAGDAAGPRRAARRGSGARPSARLPPARREPGGAAGAARRRVDDHRRRHALAARGLSVLPDPRRRRPERPRSRRSEPR